MTPGSRQLGAQVTDCRPRHSSAECHPRVTYSSPHMLCCQIQERRGRRQRPDTKRHCHKMNDMQFLQTEPMTSANRARVSCTKEAQHDKGRCLRTAKRVSRHPPRGPTYPATRTNITRHADQHTPPRGPTYPAALTPALGARCHREQAVQTRVYTAGQVGKHAPTARGSRQARRACLMA